VALHDPAVGRGNACAKSAEPSWNPRRGRAEGRGGCVFMLPPRTEQRLGEQFAQALPRPAACSAR